jgi:hypothetical protein
MFRLGQHPEGQGMNQLEGCVEPVLRLSLYSIIYNINAGLEFVNSV